MKKIIINFIILNFFFHPLLIFSQKLIPDFTNPAICSNNQTIDCLDPRKCDLPDNLKNKLCNLENEARTILTNYKSLDNAYTEFIKLSITPSILIKNFTNVNAPQNMAINKLTNKYEIKDADQEYFELNNFSSLFPDNKVNCLILKQSLDELKKQQNFKIANIDEMYSIIWDKSCAKINLEELSSQLKHEADIKEKLMNEVARQKINAFNKLIVDSQGNPITKDNKLQFEYDSTLSSINPQRSELKIGPNNELIYVVINIDLLNIKKVKDYLDFLFCLLKFKTEYCVTDEKEKSELKKEIQELENKKHEREKTEKENEQAIYSHESFCSSDFFTCVSLLSVTGAALLGFGVIYNIEKIENFFKSLFSKKSLEVIREAKVANANALLLKEQTLNKLVTDLAKFRIEGFSRAKLGFLDFTKTADLKFIGDITKFAKTQITLNTMIAHAQSAMKSEDLAKFFVKEKYFATEGEALEYVINLRKIVK